MIETRDSVPLASGLLGVIARDLQARLLNYSPSGCLFETNVRVPVGTIGRLCFTVDGRQLADDVQIVRCQPIEGAGSLFQVGARFLWAMLPGSDTLRRAFGGGNEGKEPRIEESQAI